MENYIEEIRQFIAETLPEYEGNEAILRGGHHD